MDLFELLQRGYFPKELPPAFNTYKFALKGQDFLSRISAVSGYDKKSSAPAFYSIEKSDVSRRTIHIPNPLNYLKLADVIVRNEINIIQNIPHSPYSISRAYYESDISKRCITPRHILLSVIQRAKLKMALSKRYEVKLDVANFYPTIYTHSISWALLGRDKAKAIWGMSRAQRSAHIPASEVTLYQMADDIDVALRNCNECQTHGILIGPDVSFLIGELIMSRIDANMAARYPHLKGHRYYDDYTYYVDTSEEADEIYQALQEELRQFGLEINEAKFVKKKAPSAINEEYVREINPVRITNNNMVKTDGLIRLFDIMWKCAELKPEKTLTIFKYGLSLLINQRIKLDKSNKDIYEPLLYKTAILKPSLLPSICKIFDFSSERPSIDMLSDTITTILKEHVPYAKDNEVAWALWMCKKYGIDVEKQWICNIFQMRSPICSIILLDILHNLQPTLLVNAEVQTYIGNLSTSWSDNSLYSEDWLLMYEASEHGWIDNSAYITADHFFSMLHNEGVMFYDCNANADYTSYDYIETLPYDYYPPSTRDEAKILKDKILDKVREEAFNKYFDDDSEDGEEVESLRDLIDAEIEDMDFDKDILDRILNPVFRGEEIDDEKLVREFIERIRLYSDY